MRTAELLFVALLMAITALPSAASTPDVEWIQGVVVLKVESHLFVDIQENESVTELGITNIDDYLCEIDVTSILRRFPTAQPPVRNGVDIRPIYEIHFSAPLQVPEVCERLEDLDGVKYACPALIYTAFYDYNDPRRREQYNLNLIDASGAHDITTGNRRVIVAICDTGILANHPDLAGNLWINPGEDLNGNGAIDENERNNRDDDRDGKIDDFYGWDLVENDNVPQDTYGHGTHVGGIVSAVTNNQVGISSIGFQTALMVIRNGTGPGITAGYPSIVLAVDLGASVINCSWGGYGSSQEGNDAAAYAADHDVLFVAAAGNSGSGRVMFPAGYDHVMSVAATDQDDRKAGFSNYGSTIDISAPGVGILSTTSDGGYGPMDGTSMASPLVAGAAALFMSEFEDYTADMVQNFLKFSADDLHQQNGAMADQMGGGRLNVPAAFELTATPLLIYGGARLASDQNRNGKLDPGERATIVATVSNYSHAPDSLVLTLTSEDPDVDISVGEVRFPNIGPGESHTNNDQPFVFTLDENTIPHTTRFTITVDAQPGDFHTTQTLPLLIGHPNILIVDDDDGLDYQTHIQRSVEEMHQGWLAWDVRENAPPEPDTLLQFRMVIWMTGDASPPLDDQERWTISQVVERGGNILLTGRYIGDDNTNVHFLMSSFGTAHLFDSTTAATVVSVAGRNRPLDAGIEMRLTGMGGSGDGNISPSTMRPYAPADTFMVYHNEGQFAGVAGTYRVDRNTYAKSAYLGFTFEGVSDEGTHPDVVLEQLLSWFAPDLAAPLDRKISPLEFSLNAVYPNPFNGMATLRYRLGGGEPFRLAVADISGREVALLANGISVKGDYSTIWNASAVPSGVYFLRLETQISGVAQQRVILVK